MAQNAVLSQIAKSTRKIESKMASFSDMDKAIANLKMRIKTLNEQMYTVACTMTDMASTASSFSYMEREKMILQAQLNSIEKSYHLRYQEPEK